MSEKAATYPASVIARLLLMTERRVQQLSAEGVIPKAHRGSYPLAPAVQGYVKYLKERADGAGADSLDIGAYKARLIKARARTAELEADLLEGKLLDRAEVEQAWKTIILNMRAKLMAIPTRAAPQLIGAASIGQAAALLDLLVTEALNELAEQPLAADCDPGVAGDGPSGDRDGGPAAETDDQPMG